MKVWIIDPSLFGWPYDVRLAQGLEAIGHRVQVIGKNPGRALPPEEARFLREHFYPGFESSFMKKLPPRLFLFLKGLSHIESLLRLLWRAQVEKPDVIHFMWAPLAIIDRRFVPLFRRMLPVIYTVHDSAPYNNSPRSGLQRLGAIEIMKQFDELIVHTEAARARVESYGIAKEKINVIPHGLLLEIGEVRDEPKKIDDKVTLVLFGQIKPYKGADILIRAIAKLPHDVRDKCRVRIIGKPYMPMHSLFALVNELGVGGQIEFDLRFVPDEEVKDIMLQADIQMFPYREIDASGVLMLAIPAGKVIVASNIGLFAEMLEDGKHGALVKPEDPDALAAALAPLIADPQRRARAAQEVKALANAVPTWTEIARRTEVLYRRAGAKVSSC